MAVRVNIVKGVPEKFEEYRPIFDSSSLYEHYLKDTDMLKEGLMPALKKGEVYIAETEKGEAVGLMYINLDGMYGSLPMLDLLGVKEGFRSKGIGETLLKVYIGICRELGYKKAFTGTSDFNVRALKLYQRFGFKKIVTVPNLLKDGIAEHILMFDIK